MMIVLLQDGPRFAFDRLGEAVKRGRVALRITVTNSTRDYQVGSQD